MYYMASYSIYYIAISCIISAALLTPIVMNLVFSNFYRFISPNNTNLTKLPLITLGHVAIIFSFSVALYLLSVNVCQSYQMYSLKSFGFSSVFDSGKEYWAKSNSSSQWLSRNSQLLPLIRSKTRDGSLLIVPRELKGNSEQESSPIFEYYTQRHAIPVPPRGRYVCPYYDIKMPNRTGTYLIDTSISLNISEICSQNIN